MLLVLMQHSSCLSWLLCIWTTHSSGQACYSTKTVDIYWMSCSLIIY